MQENEINKSLYFKTLTLARSRLLRCSWKAAGLFSAARMEAGKRRERDENAAHTDSDESRDAPFSKWQCENRISYRGRQTQSRSGCRLRGSGVQFGATHSDDTAASCVCRNKAPFFCSESRHGYHQENCNGSWFRSKSCYHLSICKKCCSQWWRLSSGKFSFKGAIQIFRQTSQNHMNVSMTMSFPKPNCNHTAFLELCCSCIYTVFPCWNWGH